MTHGGKTCWRAIRVHGPEAAGLDGRHELHGAERLVALYRFQNGEGSAEHGFTIGAPLASAQAKGFGCCVGDEGCREVMVTDPAEVDWDNFPVIAALEAITRDELSRLRSLLHADAGHLFDARARQGNATCGDEVATTGEAPTPPVKPQATPAWGLRLGVRAPGEV